MPAHHMRQIREYVRLRQIPAVPGVAAPIGPGPRVAVDDAFGVGEGAWVAVPEPGAADGPFPFPFQGFRRLGGLWGVGGGGRAALVGMVGEEGVELVGAAEAGAHDEGVVVVVGGGMSTNEHLDGPSEERKGLVGELAKALNNEPVLPAFWACAHVCDLERLRWLVANAQKAPYFVAAFADQCFRLALAWRQSPADDQKSQVSDSGSSDGGRPRKRLKRAGGPRALAEERDRERCVFTKAAPYQVAHIYPNCLIESSNTRRISHFWNVLQAFWTQDKINSWRSLIFRDPENPLKPFDACFNLICMNNTMHTLWGDGHFAIRPLNYNDDKTKLEAEIHWLPRYNHGPLDSIPLDTPTLSSRGLQNSSYRNGVQTVPIHIDGQSITSGHKVVFETTDPKRLPLPSRELLEMQWALNRVLSMSAAVEYQGYDEDDDDDDMLVGEAAPSQGPVERHSESSSDEQENSFLTSLDPSPIKTTTAVDTSEQSEVEAGGATAGL
ncbi:hypothetical protein RJZ57_008444 [Blastomyces gilchristii]